jgi:CheY-like chemotaxis protein
VLVVDDHAGFREMARALAVSGGLDVVAEAGDGATALTLCRQHRPDLVLLDIGLPDLDGFDVRRRILDAVDPPVVLLTSSRDAASYGARLTGPEPIPFVPKDELSVAALVDLLPPD